MKDMEAVSLCGKPGGRCCPVFVKKGRKYSISDKGQEVLFTKEQLTTFHWVLHNQGLD